ncbi:hypothetical protein SCA6_009603 [Theobroma cacao]
MEDASSTREVTAQATPGYYPWSFNEVIRAILRCLGLENEFHQDPSSPKKEDDGTVNGNTQAGCLESPVVSPEAGADPPSTTDQSDPPRTVTDDPPADPPSTTEDDPGLVISLSAPKRPGTSSGSGPQIN